MKRFLLARTNERFVRGETKWTSQERRAALAFSAASVFCVLVGVVLISHYLVVSRLIRHLKGEGQRTEATIVGKRTAGQDKDEYYVTVQFSTQSNDLVRKEGKVSGEIFDHVEVGEKRPVWYIPKNPRLCLLEDSMKTPVEPFVFVVVWCLGSGIALVHLCVNLFRHHMFARRGVLIDGTFRNASVLPGGFDTSSELEVTFGFVSPSGRMIEAKAKGNPVGSNLSELERVGFSRNDYHPAFVAVLYLADDRYLLL